MDLPPGTVAAAAALVKDLVNTPAQWLGPQDLAEAAQGAVADLPVEVTVLDETALEEQGFGWTSSAGTGSGACPRAGARPGS